MQAASNSTQARGVADYCALSACVLAFAIGGLFVLTHVPFPTAYDELQHLSFIRALREAPTLYPQYGGYRVLSGDGQSWTDAVNYIAHPPLYYLLLAPFGDDVALLRGLNFLMAVAGFTLCATSGISVLPTVGQRCTCLALLALLSKPALVAGMINNDNLVLLETGLLFALLVGEVRWWRPYAIALILAAVGWTKFNAFVGLALWIGVLHLVAIARGQRSLFGRTSLALLAGGLIGAAPALHNLATFGSVAYVPVDFLLVEPSVRPAYDFSGFAAAFFAKIGTKILYMDGLANLMPFIAALAIAGAFAAFARTSSRRTRDIAVSAWIATLAFAILHVVYGWNSFRTLGSMSDAQSRYYVMLWPGFALAAVLGTGAIIDRARAAGRAGQQGNASSVSGLFGRPRSLP